MGPQSYNIGNLLIVIPLKVTNGGIILVYFHSSAVSSCFIQIDTIFTLLAATPLMFFISPAHHEV